MQYTTVSGKNVTLSRLTDPAYKEYVLGQWNKIATLNNEVHDRAVKKWSQWCVDSREIYGANSAVYKYAVRNKVPKPPNITGEWEKLMKKLKTWENKEAKRIEKERLIAKAREKAKDYRDRSKAAKVELEENGYIPEEHFRPTAAISFKKKVLVESPDGQIVRALPAKAEGERKW